MRHAIIPNVKIAVVDHERLTREFVVNVMMYSVNREVLAFEDAAGIMAFFNSGQSADLVITDVYLPDMSGLDLLKSIKKSSPHTFVIAMSANPADEKPSAELGADAFLAKPFVLQDLFAIVQKFVVEAKE